MSTPVLPVIIRGGGIIIFNGYSYYTKDAITIKPARKTFPVVTDIFGTIDTRAESLMVDIEFTPAGEIETLVKYFPYGPSNLTALASVGNSIFTASNVPCVIHTRAGQTITYARAGIAKSPTLFLSPRKTAYGPMTISALGSLAVQQTTSAWLKTIASVAFSDTGFDDSKVLTDIYTATLGSRSAPYNAMGARSGFELEPVIVLEDVPDDGVGIADRMISDVLWKCRFAPNNLTEAQVDSLANWQGTDTILPGVSVSKGPAGAAEDLIMDSSALTARLYRVGVTQAEQGVGVKVDRNGMIEFVSRMTFTSGVPNPLVSLVAN